MTARVLAAALAGLVAVLGIHVVLLAAAAVIAAAIIFLLVTIAGRVAETGWGCAPRGRVA